MAKKGGQQQIQAEINTDEELEMFLERQGLLILDVYSEWCGPVLGAVGALRKVKLEVGGDNLHLAICKTDGIEALKRFRRKSEPTWLFVTNKRAVNLLYGTEIPKLLSTVLKELSLLGTPLSQRKTYAIDELQPEEQIRLNAKLAVTRAQEKKERMEREKKRLDYLMYVTDTIMDNLPDAGVTIFGPQVNRDMFKKINEPADALKMQCKDRRVVEVTQEDFDIINFDCGNPLHPDIVEQLFDKELLVCFWRIAETTISVPEVMIMYRNELTKGKPADALTGEPAIPPIIEPLKLKIEYEVEDDEECILDSDDLPKQADKTDGAAAVDDKSDEEEMLDEEEYEMEVDAGGMPPPPMDMPPPLEFDLGDMIEDAEEGEEEETPEAAIATGPVKKVCTRKVTIPPVWVPNDHRTHAALIYVFFRSQTLGFLPPDPPPEPPHVVMTFDTYKKRDLIDLAERNRENVPLYGFFTSDDVEEAEHIASSAQVYAKKPQSADDKLILKVNKRTSHTMLSLATYGPSYVSPSIEIGNKDAMTLFPENYVSAEEERKLDKKAAAGGKGKKKEKPKDTAGPPPTKKPGEAAPAAESPSEEEEISEIEDVEQMETVGAPAEGEAEKPDAEAAIPEVEGEAAVQEGASVPQEGEPVQEGAEIPEGSPEGGEAQVEGELPAEEAAAAIEEQSPVVEGETEATTAETVPEAEAPPEEPVPEEVPAEAPVEEVAQEPAEEPAPVEAPQEEDPPATEKEPEAEADAA